MHSRSDAGMLQSKVLLILSTLTAAFARSNAVSDAVLVVRQYPAETLNLPISLVKSPKEYRVITNKET